ncbi:MAG: hypothetical protein RL264_1157 [Bacteroidota bacterium]|jgi:outer membrane protein assembly factor BamD
MTKRNTSYIASLVLGLFVLLACSDYNQVIKGDDYQRKFDTANRLYDEKRFDRCIILYEQVYQHSPKSGEGELSYYRLAKSYFETKDYYMSGYYFSSFIQRFPYSPKSEECFFYMALSNVKNSPEYNLDQTETEQAIASVQSFIDRYPNSTLVDTCNNIIDKLRFKMETKDYEAVKLFSRTENFRAAVTSSEIFLEKYLNSVYSEEIAFLLVKNSYFLTINSIPSKKSERIEQTIERINNFALRFDKSAYLKEVDNYLDLINKEKTKSE